MFADINMYSKSKLLKVRVSRRTLTMSLVDTTPTVSFPCLLKYSSIIAAGAY